jgi:hypothetical protein
MFLGTNWCKPRDHVVTQPTIKIKIWSWKAERGLIGVWHNGNLPQNTNTIGMKLNDTTKPINLLEVKFGSFNNQIMQEALLHIKTE